MEACVRHKQLVTHNHILVAGIVLAIINVLVMRKLVVSVRVIKILVHNAQQSVRVTRQVVVSVLHNVVVIVQIVVVNVQHNVLVTVTLVVNVRLMVVVLASVIHRTIVVVIHIVVLDVHVTDNVHVIHNKTFKIVRNVLYHSRQ